jgi:hypothetical protein
MREWIEVLSFLIKKVFQTTKRKKTDVGKQQPKKQEKKRQTDQTRRREKDGKLMLTMITDSKSKTVRVDGKSPLLVLEELGRKMAKKDPPVIAEKEDPLEEEKWGLWNVREGEWLEAGSQTPLQDLFITGVCKRLFSSHLILPSQFCFSLCCRTSLSGNPLDSCGFRRR